MRALSGKLRVLGLAVVGLAACAKPAPDTTAPWPEWAFHHWVWENESTQDSAIALVDGYLDRGIPVGAIIIDSPWETSYNNFEFDTARFPDPQGMIDYFHSRDVRVFLWITSAINTDSELYAEAEANGYFLKANESATEPGLIAWWKGEGSLIDYFNPDALEWWHSQMDTALALGIDGWKCDGTDPFVVGTPWSPGAGRPLERAEYADAYYRDFFDYTRAVLGDDRIVTARPIDNYGGGSGGAFWEFAPRDINWAAWVGDQDGTFGGMADALDNMYWSQQRGHVAFGSDIGGFRTEDTEPNGRSKEVFVRWAQLGAFNPIMENGGGGEHRPWLYDAETTQIYTRFVELHYALLPYLMEHGGRAFASGTSLMQFERKSDYAYRLGPDLFVSPMLESGTSKTVTFPSGTWVYLFDPQQVFNGGSQITLEVPLAEFPVFVRSGSPIGNTLLEALD